MAEEERRVDRPNVPPQAILHADGITHEVALPGGRRLTVLNQVQLTVAARQTVAIQGRSGSGKSTLLATLGLLTRPTAGRVLIGGVDATVMSDTGRAKLRNQSIGMVFQSYSLARHLNAAQNVALPLRYGAPVPRKHAQQRVAEALALVGLCDRARSRPRALSGGEQQRVAIARALIRSPKLILADEPTGALDTVTAGKVIEILLDSARQRGCAVIIVTHDASIAESCDRRFDLDEGCLSAETS